MTCLTDNRVGKRKDGKEFQHDVPRAVGWSHVIEQKQGEQGTKKTPLGDTFKEITEGMIALIKDYYQKYGRYPSRYGDEAYTDIGLDPADWKLPVDNIYYIPAGSRVNIAPETGYTLEVMSVKGKKFTLPSGTKQYIFYDMAQEKWYYKTASAAYEVDISTLKVAASSGSPPKPKPPTPGPTY